MKTYLLTTQENDQYVTREWTLTTESNNFGDQLITLKKYDFDDSVLQTIKYINHEGSWQTPQQIKNSISIRQR